jgi:peptidoglycan/xylan/chitin deacetylase (PgdA/CDA1 family)
MTGPLILLYHRVTTLDTDPQLLAVSPEHFAAHLSVLQEIARPMPLSDLVTAARAGEDLHDAVAITFDDGYEDNLLTASRILQLQGVSATIFVATAGLHAAREFFWDDLDRIFLQPNCLPSSLHLQLGSTAWQIDLGEDAAYSPADAARHRHWNVTLTQTPTNRHRAYRELCALLHASPSQQREYLLEQIHEWSCLSSRGRPTHRMLSETQLKQLAQNDLIDIGAHTITHPLLSAETPEVQQREILGSKTTLESILQRRITSFSYPFGGRRDYTVETVVAVKQSGLQYACSNFPAPITTGVDPFQFPRVLVRDLPAEEFRKRVTQWLGQTHLVRQ